MELPSVLLSFGMPSSLLQNGGISAFAVSFHCGKECIENGTKPCFL